MNDVRREFEKVLLAKFGRTYEGVLDLLMPIVAEHDRAVAADAIRKEADAIAGYTMDFGTPMALYKNILWLMRRDADIVDPAVDDLAKLLGRKSVSTRKDADA